MSKLKKNTAFCNYAKKEGYANNCLQEVEEHSINKVFFDAFNWRYLCDNCLQIAPKHTAEPKKQYMPIEISEDWDRTILFDYLQENSEKHTIPELYKLIRENLMIEISEQSIRTFCHYHKFEFKRIRKK